MNTTLYTIEPAGSDGNWYVLFRGKVVYVAQSEESARTEMQASKRRRINARNRARYGMMRDIGLVKTPYGWE